VRADRLLSILMLLQARGRMTAGQLAAELEVSLRTIYRDIDALCISGVPIYSERGRDGGYALLDGYRTSLTGLNENEVRALFMLSIPSPLRELGVGQELETALRKLVAALPAARREDVILVSQMADLEVLRPLAERARQVLGARVKTHLLHNKNYGGYILELVSPSSDKWAALAQVAADAGIVPREIAAIGDDVNDIDLVRRAGLGIAMANGAEQTRAAADLVVRSNAEEGVVEAIERVLAGR